VQDVSVPDERLRGQRAVIRCLIHRKPPWRSEIFADVSSGVIPAQAGIHEKLEYGSSLY
jgi:hypothetical protein